LLDRYNVSLGTVKLDDTDSGAVKARTSWFSEPFIWLIAVTGFLCRVLLLA
jgi:hypothetical protein